MAKLSPARLGFMLCAFLLPGLIGTFASFSIPAPLVDEIRQEQALQAVLNAPTPQAQAAAIAALSGNEAQTAMATQAGMTQDVPDTALVDPDTASIVQNGTGPIAARVAAAQQNMRVEVMAQARAEAYRIRLMVITMTVLGAVFGVFLMGPDERDDRASPDLYCAATARQARMPRPALSGTETADVCVIGAGFTGINAALELAERGVSVIALEAVRVGFSASGRVMARQIAGRLFCAIWT